ncbi:MAG: thermonuclease family protein [Caldilineaceae bacterium]|nr:thermonuclease family protein [Caldilineaceae bacterium]
MTALRVKSQLYHYAAVVTDVYDGDTITVDMDLGLGIWRKGQKIRFWKVDTPELKGPDRVVGLQVRDFISEMLLNKEVLIRTILDKRGVDSTGKFGRLLGEILVEDEEGRLINVNQLLLERGLAEPMGEDGSRTREVVAPEQSQPSVLPTNVECAYCGQLRLVNVELRIVEACPNCLDPAYPISG